MTIRFLWCLLGVLCLALAGCGGGSGNSSSASSGVSGVAQLTTRGGPALPGGTSGTTRPLPNAVITVQPQGGGAEITRALTGPNGEFRIALKPGTYKVVPLVSATAVSGTTAQSQDVTVSAGGDTTITVQYTLNLP